MEENYIYIGKIVNTHGIKGELRILSDFKYKEKVFLANRRIYIGDSHEEEIINTYRHHKVFEMITLKGYNNINQVLKYLNKNVYVRKNDLGLGENEYLDSDLINLSIYLGNREIGKVMAIKETGGNNKIIETLVNGKSTFIPYHKDFVKKIDLDNKIIELEFIEGMI